MIETTENPRHLYLLHAYNRHRYLEMAGRWEEIFAPEMTVEKPVYHFNMLGKIVHARRGRGRSGGLPRVDPHGSVRLLHRRREARRQRPHDRLDVDDVPADPGSVLAAEGAPVDPDAMYLVKTAEHMIWPYDDKGRLIGEDVWEYDEYGPRVHPARPGRGVDRRAGRQVAGPLIKPLPAYNPFTA